MPGNRDKSGGVLTLMVRLVRTTTPLVALAIALTACGAAQEPSAGAETTTTLVTTTTTQNETTTTMPTFDPQQLPIVEEAKIDLAQRLGVDPEELEVVSAEATTWPDGSIGCPEPGMSYTQSLVEGSKVLLGHDGRVYDYHAGGDGEPFLCPSDEKDGGHEFVPPPGFDK